MQQPSDSRSLHVSVYSQSYVTAKRVNMIPYIVEDSMTQLQCSRVSAISNISQVTTVKRKTNPGSEIIWGVKFHEIDQISNKLGLNSLYL